MLKGLWPGTWENLGKLGDNKKPHKNHRFAKEIYPPKKKKTCEEFRDFSNSPNKNFDLFSKMKMGGGMQFGGFLLQKRPRLGGCSST